MKYYTEIDGQEIVIDIVEENGRLNVRSGNGLIPYDVHSLGNGFISIIIDGKLYDFHVVNNDEGMVHQE